MEGNQKEDKSHREKDEEKSEKEAYETIEESGSQVLKKQLCRQNPKSMKDIRAMEA